MNETIQTNKGPMTPDALVNDLIYSNYAHNRRISPHVSPQRWAKVYPNAEAMEQRYQMENGA